MNTITCKKCGELIEVDRVLEGQIEERVLAAARLEHEVELRKAKQQAAELAKTELSQQLEFERQRIQLELEGAARKQELEQEHLVKRLKDDAAAEKQSSVELRVQTNELMENLREEKKARANAEFEAQKKLVEAEDKIREDARKGADEKYRYKEAELEKKITDMQKSLDEAQRKAAQGSQQNQGEVLELDLENRLREEFPFDEIGEIKKGQRGADIAQTVRNQSFEACGVLLWETKNGKWQPAWIAKFKGDIREATASIGVLVSNEMPMDYGDMRHVEGNVWAVKPALAPALAVALRATILQVDGANKMNAGKDVKMEALYQFLAGPEFRHRVEAIVENYGMLQSEIEKEKRAAALRWAHQEKAIRAVIDNTIGMYGDLQGITSRALPPIRSLELEEEIPDTVES
jgi:hypothetical protein